MTSLLVSLTKRELGYCSWTLPSLEKSSNRKLDSEFDGTPSFLATLKSAVHRNDWEDIEASVGDVILNLLDNSSESQLFNVTPKKRQQREQFVLGGGIEVLLRLFRPPYLQHKDARGIPPSEVRLKSEVWNEILVILREVAFAIPTLSDKVFNTEEMIFFFTMLHHQPVFDNTMNLLEEILASREDTFQLSLVPNFYTLIGNFSARQLAHFCRVLSLVLFEPEDRHVMEGLHVLHSTELLQLRRNRMSKNCGGVVERNQSLMIDMPGLLSRLVHILRIINFGPSLADMLSHNIVPQMPITSDVLTFFSSSLGISDWDHFASLEQIVVENTADSAAGAASGGSSRASGRGWNSNSNSNSSGGNVDMATLEDEDITSELLSSFSRTVAADGSNSQTMDLANIVNVMQVARSLGIADMTPLGEALLVSQPHLATPPGGGGSSVGNTPPTSFAGWLSNARSGGARRSQRQPEINPGRARKELQFHAMLLSPHQIELIFVLCTLLSGRRKIAVQAQFADAGLDSVLLQMFDRMSWSSRPSTPAGGAPAHIHGPNCSCESAESPLRVQFLRLIHNFYDRDFLGNENKLLMLSAEEKAYVMNQRMDASVSTELTATSGLLSKTIHTLMKEPPESVYKFWLSACVENFLRGCGRMGQSLVAQYGVLEHTVQHIIQNRADASVSLQTSFDLLGEVVKCNHTVLAQLNNMLSEEEFAQFRSVVLKNLIDSNVFLRSLYLSLDMVTFSYHANEADALTYQHPTAGLAKFGFHMNSLGVSMQHAGVHTAGYLHETWVQFNPTVLVERAVLPGGAVGKDVSSRDRNKPSTPSKRARTNSSAFSSSNSSSNNNSNSINSLSRSGVDNNDDSQYPGALSSIGSGVLGALKDIRKATKHFLSFGESSSGSVHPVSGAVLKEEGDISIDCADLGGEAEFFDCRTSPTNAECSASLVVTDTPQKVGKEAHNASTEAIARSIQSVLLAGSPAKKPVAPWTGTAEAELEDGDEMKLQDICDGADSNSRGAGEEEELQKAAAILASAPTPAAPANLSRISAFLEAEKTHVLVRLMSTVTLGSINHENICCLNTALLVLLLEHKRSRLGATLTEVKRLADQELRQARARRAAGEEDLDDSLGSLLLGLDGKGAQKSRACCPGCQTGTRDLVVKETATVDNSTSIVDKETGSSSLLLCGACAGKTEQSSLDIIPSDSCKVNALLAIEQDDNQPLPSGSELMCLNFRELLWYWQEYYFRRGRDRLSVEFSCHIPFRYWQSVVGLMCSDNGDPTSLLPRPVVLPPSPYSRPTPGHPAALPGDQNSVCNL